METQATFDPVLNPVGYFLTEFAAYRISHQIQRMSEEQKSMARFCKKSGLLFHAGGPKRGYYDLTNRGRDYLRG